MPATKRRPGRPFGSRRRTSTPQRARHPAIQISPVPASRIRFPANGSGNASPLVNGVHTPKAPTSVRRTRSRLGEVVNGADADESTEGGAVRSINGRRSGTRSSTGSPRNIKGANGKGKAAAEEDDDDEVDAEGEDVDELMDIDAEGEYDDEADAVMTNG